MKKNVTRFLMVACVPAVLMLASCASKPEAAMEPDSGATIVAQTPGVAGGQMVDTITLRASVVAVDQKERTATLKRADGETVPIRVGPEAVNFAQVKVGDQVVVTLTRSLLVYVAEPGSKEGDDAGAVVVAAPEGEKPAGLAAGAVQLTAKVQDLNMKKRTATLRFEDGTTETVPVRADVDMSKYKNGDKVVFRVSGAITIEVVKP